MTNLKKRLIPLVTKIFIAFCVINTIGNFFGFSMSPKIVKAEICEMDWADLKFDFDFVKAVKDIIQDCKVQDGKISCV